MELSVEGFTVPHSDYSFATTCFRERYWTSSGTGLTGETRAPGSGFNYRLVKEVHSGHSETGLHEEKEKDRQCQPDECFSRTW